MASLLASMTFWYKTQILNQWLRDRLPDTALQAAPVYPSQECDFQALMSRVNYLGRFEGNYDALSVHAFYTENDEPHPQVDVAEGFLMTNCAPCAFF